MDILEISGAEGGGQLLRTALTLSICTGTPFRMTQIRARRARPGLMRQHLTAVEAAREVCGGTVTGALPGSQELAFTPAAVRAGDYRFSIGTAGSTTLVLQTILPTLLQASAPSTIVLEGGTHNPMAPPADFLMQSFAPLLARMGAGVTIELERYGFYPAGGGAIRVTVAPGKLQPISIMQRGELKSRRARAVVSAIPGSIAERELAVVAKQLGFAEPELEHRSVRPAVGPGNALMVWLEFENITAAFTGFGERGVSAETVAERVCQQVKDYLASNAAVEPHLADQLLLPMALAGEGEFSTTEPTEHLKTNAALIEKFAPVEIEVVQDPAAKGLWRVSVCS